MKVICWAFRAEGNDLYDGNRYHFPGLHELMQKHGHEIYMKKDPNPPPMAEVDLVVIHNRQKKHYTWFVNNADKYPQLNLLILPLSYCTEYVRNRSKYKHRVFHGNNYWQIRRGIRFRPPFILPIPNYQLEHLTPREEFFQQYGLDPNLKMITYFEGRFDDTWFQQKGKRSDFFPVYKTSQLIIQHLPELKEAFLKRGYQLVIKGHRLQNFKRHIGKKKTQKLENVPLDNYLLVPHISPDHSSEILKYTDLSIVGTMSTVQLMTALYGIKTIHFDEPAPNSWIKFLDEWKYYQLKDPKFKKVKHQDYRYGITCRVSEFLQNSDQQLKKLEDLSPYQYAQDHPYYGDSAQLTSTQYLEQVAGVFDRIEKILQKRKDREEEGGLATPVSKKKKKKDK